MGDKPEGGMGALGVVPEAEEAYEEPDLQGAAAEAAAPAGALAENANEGSEGSEGSSEGEESEEEEEEEDEEEEMDVNDPIVINELAEWLSILDPAERKRIFNEIMKDIKDLGPIVKAMLLLDSSKSSSTAPAAAPAAPETLSKTSLRIILEFYVYHKLSPFTQDVWNWLSHKKTPLDKVKPELFARFLLETRTLVGNRNVTLLQALPNDTVFDFLFQYDVDYFYFTIPDAADRMHYKNSIFFQFFRRIFLRGNKKEKDEMIFLLSSTENDFILNRVFLLTIRYFLYESIQYGEESEQFVMMKKIIENLLIPKREHFHFEPGTILADQGFPENPNFFFFCMTLPEDSSSTIPILELIPILTIFFKGGKTISAERIEILLQALLEKKETFTPMHEVVFETLRHGVWKGADQTTLHTLDLLLRDPYEMSMCPVCLGIVRRESGCQYMSHNCTVSSPFFHRELYENSKDEKGNITWCTYCSRICFSEYYMQNLGDGAQRQMMRHFHFKLDDPFEEKQRAVVNAAHDPFSPDCIAAGGGGIVEKFDRLLMRRNMMYDFQKSIDKVLFSAVQVSIIENCWIASLQFNGNEGGKFENEVAAREALQTKLDEILQTSIAIFLADETFHPGLPLAEREKQALRAAQLKPVSDEELRELKEIFSEVQGIANVEFPPENPNIHMGQTRAEELLRQRYESIDLRRPRLAENAKGADGVDPLAPVKVENEVENPEACSFCTSTNKPRLWKFHHRKNLGAASAAAASEETRSRGERVFHKEMLCDQCIRGAIEASLDALKVGEAQDFGQCPFRCGALLWPEELLPMIHPYFPIPADEGQDAQGGAAAIPPDTRPTLDEAFVNKYKKEFDTFFKAKRGGKRVIRGGGPSRQLKKPRSFTRRLSQKNISTFPSTPTLFFLDNDPSLQCASSPPRQGEARRQSRRKLQGGSKKNKKTRRRRRRRQL